MSRGDMAVSELQHGASPWLSLRSRARDRWRIRASLKAWCNAWELDRQLAAGASPSASYAHAVRARRITSTRSRKRVADGLVRALGSAQSGRPGFTAAVRPNAREALGARTVLTALDRRLRAREPVAARGVASLLVLLTDGSSPLYQHCESGLLGSRLRAAAAALEPTDRSDPRARARQARPREDALS